MNRINLIFVFAFFLVSLVSCSNKEDYARKEIIRVYTTEDESADLSLIQADMMGDTIQVCIRSSVDFRVAFRMSESSFDQDWIQVGEAAYDEAKGCSLVRVVAKEMSGSFEERYGVLSISAPEHGLSRFVKIRQGYEIRKSEDFSWLTSGNASPGELGKEVSIHDWTDSQKENGYESTPVTGQEKAFCYGNKGFLMLGAQLVEMEEDKEVISNFGADVITPFLYPDAADVDSVMIVTFEALAHDADAVLTVEVTGGGCLMMPDGMVKTVEVEPSVLLPDAKDPWEGAMRYLKVYSVGEDRIGAQTRLRFVAGALEQMDKPSRIYIDDIVIYSVEKHHSVETDDFTVEE